MLSISPFCFYSTNYQSRVSGKDLLVYDTYSKDLIARVPQIGQAEYEAVIASSIHGFQEMRKTSPQQRIDLLQKLHSLLLLQQEEFISLIVAEAGKPIMYAKQEFERSLKTIEAGIREAGLAFGEMIPMHDGQLLAFTDRFPTGPILGITPFNFPLNLALHKLIPALAVGTSILLKAPPQAPLTLLKLAGLIAEAGAPAGAVNVVVCETDLAEAFVKDDRFSVLSFTGSDRVGFYLKSIAGHKKVILELGGNAPVLVDASADLASAAKQIALGAFAYSGQVCISTQRIYVVDEVMDQFKDLLISETTRIRSGDPQEEHTVNGPLIHPDAAQRIGDWINEAIRHGAEVLSGALLLDPKASIFAPTILSKVDPSDKVMTEEVFGPVAILESARNLEHAIKLANSGRFGLQAGVFTAHIDHFKTCFRQLEYGGIMFNKAPGFRVDHMPYGGVKSSGIGREGIRYTMHEFTESRLAVF